MKIVLFANTDWYLHNFRHSLANALLREGHEVVLISPEGSYGPRLQQMGFTWLSLPMSRRGLNPFVEAMVIARLWRILRREKADVLHNFTLKSVVYGSFAAKLAGIPATVNSVAGLGHVFSGRGLRRRVLRRALSLVLLPAALTGGSARLILQNPDDVLFFENLARGLDGQIRLIRGSGVDCERFRPARPRVVRPLRVLLAARLLWEKGVQEYIDAARQLAASGRKIEFLLAGATDDGNPASIPEGQMRRWAAEGVVEWLGHVDDMAALLRSVDVVALPSYYREGVPKGLVEAAATGLPLITTDSPGCREVVVNKRNGFLVPARNSRALAAGIARLYDDPELRLRFGRESRRRAVEEFEQDAINEATMNVYSELVGGPAGPRGDAEVA